MRKRISAYWKMGVRGNSLISLQMSIGSNGLFAGKPALKGIKVEHGYVLGHKTCGAGLPAKRPIQALQKHLASQPMALHLFIEGAARQLQLFEHRFHIAFMPGQGRPQAVFFESLLTSRQ